MTPPRNPIGGTIRRPGPVFLFSLFFTFFCACVGGNWRRSIAYQQAPPPSFFLIFFFPSCRIFSLFPPFFRLLSDAGVVAVVVVVVVVVAVPPWWPNDAHIERSGLQRRAK